MIETADGHIRKMTRNMCRIVPHNLFHHVTSLEFDHNILIIVNKFEPSYIGISSNLCIRRMFNAVPRKSADLSKALQSHKNQTIYIKFRREFGKFP